MHAAAALREGRTMTWKLEDLGGGVLRRVRSACVWSHVSVRCCPLESTPRVLLGYGVFVFGFCHCVDRLHRHELRIGPPLGAPLCGSPEWRTGRPLLDSRFACFRRLRTAIVRCSTTQQPKLQQTFNSSVLWAHWMNYHKLRAFFTQFGK